jgi:ribosomal-protein-alanine N-acetyltransferase
MDLDARRVVAVAPARVSGLEELPTARLRLARVRESDLADWCRLHADPRVMATLGGVRGEAETRAQIRECCAHWERYGFGPWTLREPSEGRFLGRGGLRRVTVGGREEVELLYALAAEAWGHGYATELARESARVAFEELALASLVAFTLPGNGRSLGVMRRAGFRYERDVTHAGLPHVLHRLRAPAAPSGGTP